MSHTLVKTLAKTCSIGRELTLISQNETISKMFSLVYVVILFALYLCNYICIEMTCNTYVVICLQLKLQSREKWVTFVFFLFLVNDDNKTAIYKAQ